jgi:prophage antirepressor-like protein
MNDAGMVIHEFEGCQVRRTLIDGEPLFHIGDVCAILEIQNPRQVAAKNLDKEDVAKIYVTIADGRRRQVWFTNEPGVYQFIFRSNKPAAKRFKHWLSHDVLPSIRKTGQFTISSGFVLSAPKPWARIFPDEYFLELFRLKRKIVVPLAQAPWIAGLTTDLVYRRIEEGVFDLLQAVNPTVAATESGKKWRRFKLHQLIADGAPKEKLIAFVARCTGALASFSRWEAFYEHWDARYPLKRELPHEVRITFADDSELLFSFMNQLPAQPAEVAK